MSPHIQLIALRSLQKMYSSLVLMEYLLKYVPYLSTVSIMEGQHVFVCFPL